MAARRGSRSRPIQAGEFSLGIVYPEAEVLAAAKWLQYELMAAGAVGLLALYGALFLVARSISGPITSLATAAQRVAGGRARSGAENRLAHRGGAESRHGLSQDDARPQDAHG